MKSTKAELLLQNPWESKGALLRQQTNWLHTAILSIHGTTLLLTWLDTVEGPSRLSIDIGRAALSGNHPGELHGLGTPSSHLVPTPLFNSSPSASRKYGTSYILKNNVAMNDF